LQQIPLLNARGKLLDNLPQPMSRTNKLIADCPASRIIRQSIDKFYNSQSKILRPLQKFLLGHWICDLRFAICDLRFFTPLK